MNRRAFLRLACIFSALFAFVQGEATSEAEDWTQWQGPARTNISAEKGLLQEWPAEGPKKVWVSSAAGLGYAGMAIVGDTLYTMGAVNGNEMLIALHVDSGKSKWATQVDSLFKNNWGDGPRCTPTIDGDRVYALSGRGTLICANSKDGDTIWKVKAEDLGGRAPPWGYCESVLVDGDLVVWTPGGSQGAVAALNKTTGKKAWQSSGFNASAQYSSIIAADINGQRQYIQLVQEALAGFDAKTGKLLWKTPWSGRVAVVSTPIHHDERVYISSGYGAGCKQISIDPNYKVRQVYANRVMKNQHGGVVRLGEYLYGYSDSAGWVCQRWDDGKQVWAEKSKLGKGSLTCADGRLYLLEKDQGHVLLLDPTPDGWSEKGRFALKPLSEKRNSNGRIWTHPSVANGRLYLRDQELIFSFDVSAK